MRQKATVRYQVATYAGEIEVWCDDEEDNDVIEHRAKTKLLSKGGDPPIGYQSFRITRREYVREDV